MCPTHPPVYLPSVYLPIWCIYLAICTSKLSCACLLFDYLHLSTDILYSHEHLSIQLSSYPSNPWKVCFYVYYVCIYIYIPIYIYMCVCISLSLYLEFTLLICGSTYLSIYFLSSQLYLPVCLSMNLFIYLSLFIYPPFCLSWQPTLSSVHLDIPAFLSAPQSIYLSNCLSTCLMYFHLCVIHLSKYLSN